MIAVLCLLIPPLIWVCVRERVFQNHKNIYISALSYAFCTLFLNGVMMFVLYYLRGNNGNLFSNLNSHNGFACKYIALAVVLAVAEPLIEKFIRDKVTVSVTIPPKHEEFHYWKLIAVAYSVILFFLNFIRIFDNDFWGDEAFTTYMVTFSIPEIIERTAADVHPPLYYLFVKLGYTLFGNQGWMFHLVSLIPLAIILIFALTAIWKRFGKCTSFILITLASLSANAVTYNVEVRMYSWGSLFVLLSFYYLYLILHDEANRNYILFAFFSICAAYTHYYCLVSVAFFYAIILFLSIFRKRLQLKKVLATSVVTVLAYLPWFFVLLQSMLKRVGNYWIESIPTFKRSIEYIFSSQFNNIVWICVLTGLVIVFAYESGVLKTEKGENQNYKVEISFVDIRCSADLIWMIAGLISILGTIGVGIGISKTLQPFYTLRYIYPVSALAWLILGAAVSKLKLKKVITVLLMAYMLVVMLPAYSKTYTKEKNLNDTLQTTLAATVDEISQDDIILTNIEHVNWTIARYYYPGVSTKLIDLAEFPTLDSEKCYWLIFSGKQDIDEVADQLEEQNFTYDQIVNAGDLGTHTVYIYKAAYEK